MSVVAWVDQRLLHDRGAIIQDARKLLDDDEGQVVIVSSTQWTLVPFDFSETEPYPSMVQKALEWHAADCDESNQKSASEVAEIVAAYVVDRSDLRIILVPAIAITEASTHGNFWALIRMIRARQDGHSMPRVEVYARVDGSDIPLKDPAC